MWTDEAARSEPARHSGDSGHAQPSEGEGGQRPGASGKAVSAAARRQYAATGQSALNAMSSVPKPVTAPSKFIKGVNYNTIYINT